MENLKISSPKESHVGSSRPSLPRSSRPSISQNPSSAGITTISRHSHRSDSNKHDSKTNRTDCLEAKPHDRSSKQPEKPLKAVITSKSEETHEEDEDLPPPEVTITSVIAYLRLQNHLDNLQQQIAIYEEYDTICHGTPVYLYFADYQLSHITRTVHSVRRLLDVIYFDREEGQGTLEITALEKLAARVWGVHREARKERKQTEAALDEAGKGDQNRSVGSDRNASQQQEREWALKYYVGKMMKLLKDDVSVKGEYEKMRKTLREGW